MKSLDRREFLLCISAVAVLPAAQCGGSDDRDPDPPATPLMNFDLNNESVTLTIGESLEAAGFDTAEDVPPDYEPRSFDTQISFDGRFEINRLAFLTGTATATLADGGQATVACRDGEIAITVDATEVVFGRDLEEFALVDGAPMSRAALIEQFESELDPEGLFSLGAVSRALLVLGAFTSTTGFRSNVDAARALSVSDEDTDYGYWCDAVTWGGVIAMKALGLVACAALVAGCVGGTTVTIPGIGTVACLGLRALCAALAAGLAALVKVLQDLLWSESDDVDA